MPFSDAHKCTGRKRNGEPCGQPALTGRDRCKLHGGKQGRGILSPRYGKSKTGTATLPGQYSKYIPSKLAADYRKAQNDPERLSLLHEISTWTAREQELLQRLQPHDPGAGWAQVDTAWQAMEQAKAALDTAQASKDIPGMRHAYQQFQGALEQGRKGITTARLDYGLWKEIQAVHTMLMQLRTQEHKRLMDLQRYWNAEQVAARWGQFLHGLWEACNHVLPKEHIRPLLTDFSWRIRSIDAEFLEQRNSQEVGKGAGEASETLETLSSTFPPP